MALTLVFLGRLEDVAGSSERTAPLPQPATLGSLLDTFDRALAQALLGNRVRLAVNGDVVPLRRDTALCDGDELAFLPPVSGG